MLSHLHSCTHTRRHKKHVVVLGRFSTLYLYACISGRFNARCSQHHLILFKEKIKYNLLWSHRGHDSWVILHFHVSSVRHSLYFRTLADVCWRSLFIFFKLDWSELSFFFLKVWRQRQGGSDLRSEVETLLKEEVQQTCVFLHLAGQIASDHKDGRVFSSTQGKEMWCLLNEMEFKYDWL